jgi:hypothetical protein
MQTNGKSGRPSAPHKLPKSPVQADHDDCEQSKRFVEMARELGADETTEAFDKAFGDVTRNPPEKPDAGKKNPPKPK